MDLVLTNARIITADEEFIGTLAVRDGQISDLHPGVSSLPGALDLSGDYLLPGLVELHTDNLEKHFNPRPGVVWPALPAVLAHDAQMVASGITTVFDALAVGAAVEDESRRLEHLETLTEAVSEAQRRGLTRAEHRLHLRCEVSCSNLMALWEPFCDHHMVSLVSAMDHSPGQRQFTDLSQYRLYYQAKHGLSDADMDAYIATQARAGEIHGPPNRKALVASCRRRGLPLASHDDATEAHVQEALHHGMVIAEFPTTLEAARLSHQHGMQVLMGAPNLVRGYSHSGNVSALELAGEGLVDILSSDYMPISLLHGAFCLHQTLQLPLPQAIATVTCNPARAIGLEDRGTLSPGQRGDFIRVRYDQRLPVVQQVWRGGERVF